MPARQRAEPRHRADRPALHLLRAEHAGAVQSAANGGFPGAGPGRVIGGQRGDRDDDGRGPRGSDRRRVCRSGRGGTPEEPSRTLPFSKVMATYREHPATDSRPRSRRSTRLPSPLRSSPPRRRSWSTSASRTSGTRGTSRAPCTSRAATSSRASSASRPTAQAPIVLYCASGNRSRVRREDARGARLRERQLARAAASPSWKRDGFPVDVPRGARARAAPPLLAPPADPRGRRGGAAEAARLAGPADRRGRPRLAGVALPRRRRRRHARHRRRRRRRRDEPAAPDRPLDRAARRSRRCAPRPRRSRR